MKILAIIIGLGILLAGCEQKPEPYFESSSSIRFDYKFTKEIIPVRITDVHHSFGFAPDEKLLDTLLLEVSFTGPLVENDRKYRVEVADSGTMVTGRTTMEAGKDYRQVQGEHVLRGNLWKDTLALVVSREFIDPGFLRKETKTLVLKLRPSQDFENVVQNMDEILISVNNYLAEPVWWAKFSQYLNYYHPEKYKILMKLEPALSNPEEINMTGVKMASFAELMRDYLNDNIVLDEETGQRIFIDRMEDYQPTE